VQKHQNRTEKLQRHCLDCTVAQGTYSCGTVPVNHRQAGPLPPTNPPVNIGTGTDVTIRDLTEMVQAAVGWEGEIVWDSSKPDGTPRKLLDVSKLTGGF
jgi:hypothetical protein